MKPLLNYFKLNKKICYLETNNDPNVPIYEHFGFKVMEKTIVPNSNVPHYAMLFDCKQMTSRVMAHLIIFICFMLIN